MAEPCLAVVALPASSGDVERALASARSGFDRDPGPFAALELLATPRERERRSVLSRAARAAIDRGGSHLLVLDSRETLRPEALTLAAPALRIFGSVWGAAGRVLIDGSPVPLERISRLAAQDWATFFHLALTWWIGSSHIIEPELALSASGDARGEGWYADYLMSIWRRGRALKTAQPLTIAHGDLTPLGEPARKRLLSALERDPVFFPVHQRGVTVEMPYTGINRVIESAHTRGRFFEAEELDALATTVPRGARVVDVGANTGNHALFFAAVMDARCVVAIEPGRRAGSALRAGVDRNALRTVDLTRLGVAAGSRAYRAKMVASVRGGLGATRFEPDAEGAIEVKPLDGIIGDAPVDLLKIDVEGREMDVLAGARGIIEMHRPVLFIEVLDAATRAFLAWLDANDYEITSLFPDVTHCNYVAVPRMRSRLTR